MSDGKHCPACGADIGTWPVVKAPLPNRIQCPNCKARLAYAGMGPVYLLLLLAFAGLFGVAYFVASGFGSYLRVIVLVVIIVVGWVPIEFFVAKYLRSYKVLEQRVAGDTPKNKG